MHILTRHCLDYKIFTLWNMANDFENGDVYLISMALVDRKKMKLLHRARANYGN
jgi:hypothetical protein